MRIRTVSYLFFLCCIFFHVSAFAKSPVWKISKDGNHLFVGGTIHVLSKSDYPLPDAFDAAYMDSVVLVLEADIQKLQSPEVQKTIMHNATYKGKENITRYLQPDTVKALEDHLTSRGIAVEPMLKLKPGLLSITLTMVELQRLGLAGTGVDEFFNLKALNEKRNIKYLETASEQLRFIEEMGQGVENEFIKYSLNDLKKLPDLISSLKAAWKSGDNKQMQNIAIAPFRDLFPKIHNMLLVERNNNWIPKIEKMVKTEEVELVLFGALHLVGKDGILSQLKELGYTIENI